MWCNLGKKKIYRGGGGEEQNENSGITLPLSSSSPLPSLLYATRHRFFSFFFSRINFDESKIRVECRDFLSVDGLLVYLFLFFFFFTTKHACFSFARLEKLFVLSIRKLIAIFFFYFLFLFGYLSRVVLFRFRDVKGCVRFIWRIINPSSREWDDF